MDANELSLPGFRFHPTEEELLSYYLERVAPGKRLHFAIIQTLDLYAYDPWELPGLAKIQEREWYFFVPRDKKKQKGRRPSRIAKSGYWKATGSDQVIRTVADPKCILGLRKTLVYYKGKAPKGCKTNWLMKEYRKPDDCIYPKDIVLCKIYQKATPLKALEQQAAERTGAMKQGTHSMTQSSSSQDQVFSPCMDFVTNTVDDDDQIKSDNGASSQSNIDQYQEVASVLAEITTQDPKNSFKGKLPALQMPMRNLGCTHDPSLLVYSPWMDSDTPANILIENPRTNFSPTLLLGSKISSE